MKSQIFAIEELNYLEIKVQEYGFEKISENQFYDILLSINRAIVLSKKFRMTGFVSGLDKDKKLKFVVWTSWPSLKGFCIYIYKNYKESFKDQSFSLGIKLIHNLYKYYKVNKIFL